MTRILNPSALARRTKTKVTVTVTKGGASTEVPRTTKVLGTAKGKTKVEIKTKEGKKITSTGAPTTTQTIKTKTPLSVKTQPTTSVAARTTATGDPQFSTLSTQELKRLGFTTQKQDFILPKERISMAAQAIEEAPRRTITSRFLTGLAKVEEPVVSFEKQLAEKERLRRIQRAGQPVPIGLQRAAPSVRKPSELVSKTRQPTIRSDSGEPTVNPITSLGRFAQERPVTTGALLATGVAAATPAGASFLIRGFARPAVTAATKVAKVRTAVEAVPVVGKTAAFIGFEGAKAAGIGVAAKSAKETLPLPFLSPEQLRARATLKEEKAFTRQFEETTKALQEKDQLRIPGTQKAFSPKALAFGLSPFFEFGESKAVQKRLATEIAQRRGLTKTQEKALVKELERERKTVGVIEPIAAIAQEVRSELSGTRRFTQFATKEAGKGVSRAKLFLRGGFITGTEGVLEAAGGVAAQKMQRGEKLTTKELATAGAFGFGAAGLLGGGIVATTGKPIRPLLTTVGTVADFPFETAGDILAGVGTKVSAKVTKSPVFTPTIFTDVKGSVIDIGVQKEEPFKITKKERKLPSKPELPKKKAPTQQQPKSLEEILGVSLPTVTPTPSESTPKPSSTTVPITPIEPTIGTKTIGTTVPIPPPTPVPTTIPTETQIITQTQIPVPVPTTIPTTIPTFTPIFKTLPPILPPISPLGFGGIGQFRPTGRKKFVREIEEAKRIFREFNIVPFPTFTEEEKKKKKKRLKKKKSKKKRK